MARKKRQEVRKPDRQTIQSSFKIRSLEKEWIHFNPHWMYHLPRKKFRIKALRNSCIQLLRRVRRKPGGKPTDYYIVRITSFNGPKKKGWKEGDKLKVHKSEICTYKGYLKGDDDDD